MDMFDSPFGPVELTDERWSHIVTFHPEVRLYHKYVNLTLSDPDFIRRSKLDPAVRICYRSIMRNKHLAVVLKTNQRNFVLTAYITSRIQVKPL